MQSVSPPVTRGEIAGWTIWLGGWLALGGYSYYEAHDPAAIAKAKAHRAQDDRAVGRIFAQVGCAGDIERRDDGTAPAETVARAIFTKCGPFMPFTNVSAVCRDTKCVQSLQRISLQVEIKDVLEKRYQRAQARADDAKAALERAQSQ